MTYTIVTSSPGGTGTGIYVNNSNYANPVTIGTGGSIYSASYFGAAAESAPWSIVNQGTLGGAVGGVLLNAGGGVSNAATGTIAGGDGVALEAGGTVENAGVISGSSDGVAAAGGAGYVFNASTGTITGGTGRGVYLHDGSTLENAGTITGGRFSVAFEGGGRLVIDPGAVFNGNVLNDNGNAATIELNTGASAGLLNGLGGKYSGFQSLTIDSGATWTVAGTQAGFDSTTIDGLSGSDRLDITDLSFVSGSSSATLSGGVLEVTDGTASVGITLGTADGQQFFTHDDGNHGLLVDDLKQNINGTYNSGIRLTAATYFPSVTVGTAGIVNTGSGDAIYAVSAWTVVNKGSLAGDSSGVRLNAGGTVVNLSGGTIYGDNDGVYITGAAGSVGNAGSISGYYGIILNNGGTVSNAATGTIAGDGDGVYINNAAGTVENAGTIAGHRTNAIRFFQAGANRLIIDPGAVFTGNVLANNAGSNTIELKSGASVGVLNGLGSAKYKNFQTVTIDSGAAWDIAGSKAQIAGSTITGFNSHDRIDLTDLTYNAGDTATVSGTNLIINDAGTITTIHMDSSISGQTFQLVNDGSGHTFAEENDPTPCYLRGTRIRTAAGDRPVESLLIGDLIVSAGGEALTLKWIGRRFYRGWMAVGNRDVQPVLFKAGSIAEGIPARDLYVSPEHAMFLHGMLVPAHLLTNGASIVHMDDVRDVEYFHLEFDTHAIILAEGATAESFVDDDSRDLFHNAAEYRRLYPDEPRHRDAKFCAPRVESGPELEDLRRALAARAGAGIGIGAAPRLYMPRPMGNDANVGRVSVSVTRQPI